jgi:hypothetical protein
MNSNCSECRGTGYVMLLETKSPCRTCNQAVPLLDMSQKIGFTESDGTCELKVGSDGGYVFSLEPAAKIIAALIERVSRLEAEIQKLTRPPVILTMPELDSLAMKDLSDRLLRDLHRTPIGLE